MHPNDDDNVLTPDDIGADYVPCPRADVEELELGDELMLMADDMAFVVDPIGALIWRIAKLDSAPISVLADDFAAEFATSVDVITEDLIGHTRRLGQHGLLADVAVPPPVMEEVGGLEVGDGVVPLTLDTTGGGQHAIPVTGRRTMLVNWNPGCGYCVQIGSDLAATVPGLAAEGIDLVVLSAGDPERITEVLADAGLDVPAMVKPDDPEFPDPFSGLGTPAAYLLDEEGIVIEQLAYGSGEVLVQAQRLAGDAVGGSSGSDDDPSGIESRFLSVAGGGACGPGATAAATTQEWVGTLAVDIGRYVIGVRANSEYTLDVLRRLFADSVVDTDRPAPDNYSVVLIEPGSSSKELNLLTAGSQHLVRSRSPRRVLDGLLNHLSALNVTEPRPGMRACMALAGVTADGRAILLPRDIQTNLKQYQPRLSRIGIHLADVPFVHLDLGETEIEIPGADVPHDTGVLDEFEPPHTRGSELTPAEPGRYRLTHWAFIHPPTVGPATPGLATGAAVKTVTREEDETFADVVRVLADALTGRVQRVPLWYDSPKAFGEQVGSALTA